jgi:hypothetical protein
MEKSVKDRCDNDGYYNKKNERKNIMVTELNESVLSKRIHSDLLLGEDLIYKPSGIILENLKVEAEIED